MMRVVTPFMAMLLSGASISGAYAADVKSPPATTQVANGIANTVKSLSKNAALAVSDLSIAQLALHDNMDSEASEHLKVALSNLTKLESESPQITTDTFVNMGKFEYMTSTEHKSFLIPLFEEHIAVDMIDEEKTKNNKEEMAVTNAEAGQVKIFLDVKAAKQATGNALTALKDNKPDVARKDIDAAMNSVFVEEAVIEEPQDAARHNVMLAQDLMKRKQPTAAGYALAHAKEAIARLEKDISDVNAKAKYDSMIKSVDELALDIKNNAENDASKTKTDIAKSAKEIDAKFERLRKDLS